MTARHCNCSRSISLIPFSLETLTTLLPLNMLPLNLCLQAGERSERDKKNPLVATVSLTKKVTMSLFSFLSFS